LQAFPFGPTFTYMKLWTDFGINASCFHAHEESNLT